MADPGAGPGAGRPDDGPLDGPLGGPLDAARDDRAEQALRAAFLAWADTVDATPLDPAALLAGAARADGDAPVAGVPQAEAGAAAKNRGLAVPAARRRRPWIWPAAAAVAVVALGVPLALGLGGAGGPRGGSTQASRDAGVPEAAPGPAAEQDSAGAASRPADGDARDVEACPSPADALTPADGALADLAGAAGASVCLYEVEGPGAVLRGSFAIDGEAADALFRAMVDAPAWADVAGEDLACAPTGSVLAVRFTDAADAARTARLSLGDGCGLGWYDAVTARPPSRATCADLLGHLPGEVVLDPRWVQACAP